MNCSEYFHSDNMNLDTLHKRTQLSETIKKKGISKKDELVAYLKSELKEAFECDVRVWLQGSYKSHTLIKPVDKFSSYDIDVGIYVMFDAENEEITSQSVKETVKEALISYANINDECTLQKSKNACEGLKFKNFLTIDTPVYYFYNNKIKLATDKGWVDSDPKAIQDWLTNKYETDYDRALMKRLVRYFKAWINIKWNKSEFKKIPSLAVNILVANHMVKCDTEDESFIQTAIAICNELESCFIVRNPLDNNDVINMPEDSEVYAHQQLDILKQTCLECTDDQYTRPVLLANLFEHYFPQVIYDNNNNSAIGLPATTIPPEIIIGRYDKDGNHIETIDKNSILVTKGDSLTFTIQNHNSYSLYASAQWTVRNIGEQSNDANDIGHKEIKKVSESHKRHTAYTGAHTIECLIFYNDSILGISSISVQVKPSLTVKRKKIFKGFRR